MRKLTLALQGQKCKSVLAHRKVLEEDDVTPDRIEREVHIAAPIERVWAVLTEPALVGIWFGRAYRSRSTCG